MLLVALGDLLLDVVVRLRAPLAPGADARAETRTGPGGQAANVAAWAARLGARARLVAARAGDDGGTLAEAGLRRRGVEVVGPTLDGHAGVVVSIVGADGERSMLTDRGIAPDLAPDALDPAWFEGCDRLHLSGYSLMRSPIDAAAGRAAAMARAAGARVSVDLSSWSVIAEFGAGRLRTRLEELAPDVVFANESEREALGGDLPGSCTVLKRGPRGCTIACGGTRVDLPAPTARVVDSTGAGDALAAGLLLGPSLEEGAELGLRAAGECLARLGAMPLPWARDGEDPP
jgi:sugar/nucleoside kinase (ribokinase family)